jgi:ABC-type multidrug transport system fused ATPase/permease subunit
MWSGMRGMREVLKKAYGKGKDEGAEKKLALRDIAFFFEFVRPEWKLWALSIFLILLTTAIKSLIPMSTKVLIDFVILKKSPAGTNELLASIHMGALSSYIDLASGSAAIIIASLVVLGLVYGLLELMQNYVTMVSQQKFLYTMQDSLFFHILNLPMDFFKKTESGYLASRISNDIDTLQYMFSRYLPQIIGDLAFVVLTIFLVYGLSPWLTVLLVVAMPVYVLINALFINLIHALSRLDREVTARMSNNIQETVSGVEVVKSFGSEKREAEKVSQSMRYAMYIRIVNTFLISSSQLITKGVQFTIFLLILAVGIGQTRAGTITLGDYVAFISYVFLLSGSLNGFFYNMLILQPIVVSMERIKELFTTASEFEPGHGGEAPIRPEAFSGHIRFENVSFAYGTGKKVLDNVSFDAMPGEVVAIVGASGAGKTTLINLLLKFYRPTSGTIYLDGIDLEALDSRWLREQISIVSQDIFLFNDTVENNIRYGKPDASKDEVRKAAAQAHIDNDIGQMQNAYETIIGERGTRMSLGQRQRISMARAFLKGSKLIVMDEPTSSLDPATEKQLKASFCRLVKGKTAFIISHRASMTELADRIFVIEGGKAIEVRHTKFVEI